MVLQALPFTLKLVLFIARLLQKLHKDQRRALKRTLSNTHVPHFKFQNPFALSQSSDLSRKTLIFDIEATLLKSSSLFPYFMLVAFEAGSLARAFVLFLLCPLLLVVNDEVSIKIMVMVCFFGVKKESFRVGSSVLPKFFMEDVGVEGFEAVRSGKMKIGVSKLPQVMVECFAKDYLGIEFVFGRGLKVFGGRFLGLMEENVNIKHQVDEILGHEGDRKVRSDLVGFVGANKSVKPLWISPCKEIYTISDVEKLTWQTLPKERYPKTLIFHDGRLAFRPDQIQMLVMFMWFPFGLTVSILRAIIALTVPYGASIPILAFTGLQLKIMHSNPPPQPMAREDSHHKGRLYVCNHRTLLDPLYLSFGLKRPFAAVTYSLSRMSEILSPIKTVRLTRNRDQDAKTMDTLLKQGDLVVCPEGTTCREPYLLRFSPLFAELSDEIVPVALDTYVSMFYGTTAGGLKCLDPFFFLMNPSPVYRVRFMEMVRGARFTKNSNFDVANYVQSEIGKTLDFESTMLTRKDKYVILAGNDGVVCENNKHKR